MQFQLLERFINESIHIILYNKGLNVEKDIIILLPFKIKCHFSQYFYRNIFSPDLFEITKYRGCELKYHSPDNNVYVFYESYELSMMLEEAKNKIWFSLDLNTIS